MKKTLLLSIITIVSSFIIQAQNVNIPDANFKTALVGNTSINTNGDTEIQLTEAVAYSGIINLFGFNISDATGLEAFINITEFISEFSSLTTLDVTSNTQLTKLSLLGNPLTSLDVTGINNLEELLLGQNALTALDISSNTGLKELRIRFNSIQNLDVSNNVQLEIIDAANNMLTALNVSNLPLLKDLSTSINAITSLDVSNNTMLEALRIRNNQLSALDLSQNVNLELFLSSGNPSLTTLDLSNSPNLNNLVFNNSGLTAINIASGSNASLTTVDIRNNASLNCIKIDNGFTPPSTWQKDASASYSNSCAALSTADFEDINFKIYPNPTSSILNIESLQNINSVSIYSMLGKRVFTGNSKTVNVSALKTGLYLIKVEDFEGNLLTLKFIKN